jgi:adenylate cyclase
VSEGERRLAAIMFTDMVGYTALGQRNEALSLALVEEQRKLIRPVLSRHNGREIKTIGDAFLVEFPNALDAVRCAYDIQRATREFNISLPTEKRIHLRVGLHLGDVVESQGDISGDAVNVASRIEPLAEDGGVCLTRQVYESTHGKFDVPFVGIGMKSLKNVGEPMEVFRMQMPWEGQSSTKEEIVLPRDRIAILPFANMSPDPKDEYFADGMTEEIISTVSGVSGLKVISRTSVMGYKGTNKKVKEIGRELEAGSVLEGSFRKAGNRIRVTTQLISVADDEHLWAQNYDRNLDDVFEVQSDVAKQVAEALKVKILTPELERIEKKPTESTTAYTLYLKGRYLWNKRNPEDIKKATELFEQAVREDPGFALGHVGIADCSLIMASWGVDIQANRKKAGATVARALELDQGLAEAHATKGQCLEDEHNLLQAEEEFKRAIELKPSYATAHQWYFGLLLNQLRWDEALRQVEKAVELDPLSPVMNYNLAIFYDAKRDYGRAIELFRRVTELDPSYAAAHLAMVSTYGRMKKLDEMKREATIAVELLKETYPTILSWVDCTVAYYEGDKETLGRLAAQAESHLDAPGPVAYWLAVYYFYLGENEKGFEFLERSYLKGEDLSDIKWGPDFDSIRTDPRYLDLLKRLGLDQSAQSK